MHKVFLLQFNIDMEETLYPFFQYIYAKLNEKFNYTEYRSSENKN